MTPQELAELDLAVAKAMDIDVHKSKTFEHYVMDDNGNAFMPSRDGAEAMRLLEKCRLDLSYESAPSGGSGQWMCVWHGGAACYGPTPAIAICRAVVALHATKEQPK